MEIEYVTHASLCLKAGNRTLLTDPFYRMDATLAPFLTHFPPRPIEPASFGTIDYLYSSHVHLDHSHPETLRDLKDQIQRVLLPADRPGLEARFRGLGFDNLMLMENGTTYDLGDGLEVTSVWDDPVDTCLIARMDDKVVLHLNDCLPTLETTRRIAGYHIDYAFVLYTSAQEIYPFLLSRPRDELLELAAEREQLFLEPQLLRIQELGAKVVVPYSMTLTYCGPGLVELNGFSRLTPPIFADIVRRRFPWQACWTIQPGDVIDTGTDRIARYRSENLWGADLEEYMVNVRAHARSLESTLPAFDAGNPETSGDRLKQHIEQMLAGNLAPEIVSVFDRFRNSISIHIVGRNGRKSYLVNTRRKQIIERAAHESPGFLEITLPASVVETLLEGIYDPYTLLFLMNTSFKVNGPLDLPPRTLSGLYVAAFLLLVCKDLGSLIKA